MSETDFIGTGEARQIRGADLFLRPTLSGRVDSPARPCYTPPHRETRVPDRSPVSEDEAVSGEGVPG